MQDILNLKNNMEKTVSIKLSRDEHKKFVAACKRSGVLRNNYAKKAVLDRVDKENGESED